MVSTSELLEELSKFAATVSDHFSISDVLHDLAESLTRVLGVSGAGVMLIHDGRVVFVTSPLEAIATVERVQEAGQAGPCVEAARSGTVVAVTDLGGPEWAQRWPEYTAAALAAGVRAVVGVPMLYGSDRVGAVNLHDAAPRPWDDTELGVARVFADMATGYLMHASELQQQRRTAEQLQQAMESRMVIEQAKGIICAARRISVDEAYEVLRRHARNHNAKLREVADAVVNLGLRP
jgi:GAF domain-containing protein